MRLATLLLLVGSSQAFIPWNLEADYFTTTLAGLPGVLGGENGAQENATLNQPEAVAVDDVSGMVYVADRGNHRIRAVRAYLGNASGTVSNFVYTLAGSDQGYSDGIGTLAKFNAPVGLAVDGYTRLLFVSDRDNMVIRKIELDTARVTTLAGSPGVPGFANGRGQAAAFQLPTGLALALKSRQLFVCDPFNHAVRTVHVISREVRTLAGTGVEGSADGVGEAATFYRPQAVTIDDQEQYIYLAELSPYVRRIAVASEPAYPSTGGSAYSSAVDTMVDGTVMVRQAALAPIQCTNAEANAMSFHFLARRL